MSADKTLSGEQLYRLLPELYRYRDDGDLEALLDGFGHLLDMVRNTLEQRYADNFPDQPFVGRPSQAWLLPYFADLVDARLLSPYVEGRRAEVANAIAWRQRKGTLSAAEDIAEEISRLQVEVQEGWQRVIVTPRIDTPQMPAAAGHPALPAATVDFRLISRAVKSGEGDAGAKVTTFAGETIAWRQINPHGLPCFPGSYEDVSRRTVDMRTPSWAHGHHHPKRLLLFVPPPLGRFGGEPLTFPSIAAALTAEAVTEVAAGEEPGVSVTSSQGAPVLIEEKHEISDGRMHRFVGILFANGVRVTDGRLSLERGAAKAVRVDTADGETPVFSAVDSVIDSIIAPAGLVRLEYCTVLEETHCLRFEASDCIFVGAIVPTGVGELKSCVRYSAVQPEAEVLAPESLSLVRHTSERPIFYAYLHKANGAVSVVPAVYGLPGCGVLHPATSPAIRFGAEDGGEMGAYHREAHNLAMAALVEKLRDYLPVGLEAVVAYDRRLREPPPAPKGS